MDAITTRIFIDNVFLILQRRNVPGITLDSLRLAGEGFLELCKNKDIETDIRLSGDEFEELLANSSAAERHSEDPSIIRVKPGAALGRRYAKYLPLRATVALSVDLPSIMEQVCVRMDKEAEQMSA